MHRIGVTIVAAGHPYYGRMAFNLAKTIKAIDRTCPIEIITHGNALNHISEKEMWVFDYIVQAENINGFELKLHVNELTNFDECLLLDADCVWVNKRSPINLIKELSGVCDFTGITEGFYDISEPEKSDTNDRYYFWADVHQIINEYNLKFIIYQWRTEFLFFKKTGITETLFATARAIYKEAATKLPSLKLFAGHVPDELALNIAVSLCGIHPHKYKWQPSFWHRLTYENVPQMDEMIDRYYILSCGSNMNTGNVKRAYDMFVKAASYKLGMQHTFQLISKREMMPERQKM